MCERVKFENGGVAMICGVRSSRKFCKCGREAVALCDWKIRKKKSGTCDEPICDLHAKRVGRGKHLCPEHQLRYAAWKARNPDPQMWLFEGKAA